MASHRACLVLIIDGLGDLPNPNLGGQTPLEAADTPAMNRLAAAGQYGLVDPIAPGVVPNTHSGTGLLMGMFPDQDRLLSRGPVEAAGAGVELDEGDIAFRANFATVEKSGEELLVRNRRAGRITRDTEELAGALDGMDLGDGISARLKSTDQHRCVLVLQGPGLDASIGNTDPGDQEMPIAMKRARAGDAAAFFSASKLQQFIERAHVILDQHEVNQQRRDQGLLPANAIITRGAGAAFWLDSLSRQKAISTAVVAGCNTVLGMAKLFDFTPISDARFTADIDTDIAAKIDAGIRALKKSPLVFIHFKAPDILAHDCDPAGKRDFIERIDHHLGALGLPDFCVLISADHSTDSNTGAHTEDPVPVLFYCPDKSAAGAESTEVPNFSERACRKGNMPRKTGFEMMQEVIQFIT